MRHGAANQDPGGRHGEGRLQVRGEAGEGGRPTLDEDHGRGIESLTAAERRTAELAARGRSIREIAEELFVTRKTVEGHLANLYRKLGIRSRTQLGPALTEAMSAAG